MGQESRPKLFSRALLKLTALYTGVLMLISILFSVAIGVTARNEIGRPFNLPPQQIIIQQDFDHDAFEQIFRARTNEVNGRILAALILINFGVFIFGAVLSFLLARWTLKPIERAMNDEARFVSDASHELRTPLAVLTVENEVILRDKEADAKDLRDQIQSNLDEITKLRKLTDYLLQMNSADIKVEMSECHLDSLVDEALKRTTPAARAKKIDLAHDIQPANITTNAETLTEIISIILDNAVKYSPEKSTVKIAANSDEISIQDQGNGIADEDLPHIFDRFYRAEKSRTSEGFGLGLSLAKSLAEKIGVKISAKNATADNKIIGAKFIIKLN